MTVIPYYMRKVDQMSVRRGEGCLLLTEPIGKEINLMQQRDCLMACCHHCLVEADVITVIAHEVVCAYPPTVKHVSTFIQQLEEVFGRWGNGFSHCWDVLDGQTYRRHGLRHSMINRGPH